MTLTLLSNACFILSLFYLLNRQVIHLNYEKYFIIKNSAHIRYLIQLMKGTA